VNRNRLEGSWKQFRGNLKEWWGRLAHDPQCESAGRHERIAGRVLERYGISTEESARQLKEFLDLNRGRDLSKR
jgi:uncharacterized protein YjbJ (UPF0337 family)